MSRYHFLRVMQFVISCFGIAFFQIQVVNGEPISLAILGDSLSTGAATHPKLEFDANILWSIFNGDESLNVTTTMAPPAFQDILQKDFNQPTRLNPSNRERDGGSGWIWHNLLQRISDRTLEEHRLSYGYFVGRKLGIPSEKILLAGENGSTTRQAWVQASRVIDSLHGQLPTHILFFYTGNDLCAPTLDDVTDAAEYGEYLLKGLKYLALNGSNLNYESKIYIPGFLPVTSLIHDASILDKKIKLHGADATCREARARMFAPKSVLNQEAKGDKQGDKQGDKYTGKVDDPRFQLFSAFMPPSPALICPTLFDKSADDPAHLSFLANRIRSYRESQKEMVKAFNSWVKAKFPLRALTAVYIDATETVQFDQNDIAGDCFHLSALGQGKVAFNLLKVIK